MSCSFCGKDHPPKKVGDVCYMETSRFKVPWFKIAEYPVTAENMPHTAEELAKWAKADETYKRVVLDPLTEIFEKFAEEIRDLGREDDEK